MDLIQFDKELTLAANSWGNPALDGISAFLSNSKVWIPLYLAVAAMIIWKKGWKNGLVLILAIGLSAALCDQLGNVFKHGFGRLRPTYDPYMISQGLRFLDRGGFYSFFSSHAANSFCFALGSSMALKKEKHIKTYRVLIFVWAALVSMSRIMLGRHFIGDIAVGAIIGTAISYAVLTITSKTYERIKKDKKE